MTSSYTSSENQSFLKEIVFKGKSKETRNASKKNANKSIAMVGKGVIGMTIVTPKWEI